MGNDGGFGGEGERWHGREADRLIGSGVAGAGLSNYSWADSGTMPRESVRLRGRARSCRLLPFYISGRSAKTPETAAEDDYGAPSRVDCASEGSRSGGPERGTVPIERRARATEVT